MLRKRLITVLTFNNGILFRTRNFIPDYRYTANFIDLWSIDEMVLLDITRPGQGERNNFYNIVSHIAQKCFVPVSVGGGIKTIDEMKYLLRIGADKIIVNTEAVNQPDLIEKSSKLFGTQCIVVSIDAKKNESCEYEVFTSFGRKKTGLFPSEWAKKCQELGAGEILITSIDKDGMLEGYDNNLTSSVSKIVDIPVLACGGAGRWHDFVDGFILGGASAVCTTNIYHFTEISIKSAKEYLYSSDIMVRI